MRRTQPKCLPRRTGNDGDAHHAGTAGGAATTPTSSYGKHTARERPQATRAASSPPREPPELLHTEGEAATERIIGGDCGLGFEMAVAWVLRLGGKNAREERRRWLNMPRGGRLSVRAQGQGEGHSVDARPARSDPDLARGCDPAEGMTTRLHLSARRRRIEATWAAMGRWWAAGCWAARVKRAERRKQKRGKKNCWPISKEIKTIEFKH
jgi:hypothetical protein